MFHRHIKLHCEIVYANVRTVTSILPEHTFGFLVFVGAWFLSNSFVNFATLFICEIAQLKKFVGLSSVVCKPKREVEHQSDKREAS